MYVDKNEGAVVEGTPTARGWAYRRLLHTISNSREKFPSQYPAYVYGLRTGPGMNHVG